MHGIAICCIQDDETGRDDPAGQLPRLALEFFLFQRVDQFDDRYKTHPPVMAHDGLDADDSGQLRLAGAGPPISAQRVVRQE